MFVQLMVGNDFEQNIHNVGGPAVTRRSSPHNTISMNQTLTIDCIKNILISVKSYFLSTLFSLEK